VAKRPPAAQTAFGPMVVVACEQYLPEPQRLTEDGLAIRFLPLGLRLLVRACRWRLARNLLIKASEKRAPGVWGGMRYRKRYIDDKVKDVIERTVDALVILGAGLDTRAYRLAAPAGVHTYEVDLPANVVYKRARLEALYGRVPEQVTLVSVDFETQDLEGVLAANGLRIEVTTMFVWEGVTQYLTEEGVRGTLAFLSKAGSGSRLVFTYIRRDFIDGINLYGGEKLYRQFVLGHRLWHFGIAPEEAGSLLREYGWAEREQAGRREVASMYVEPSGRDIPVSDIERCVYAEKL
jgi:methyltransferase (TIGR00027 family)